jgi:hypothetical protein
MLSSENQVFKKNYKRERLSMSKIENIRDLVRKAQELQDDSTRAYRVFQQEVQSELGQIKMNEEYSRKGKEKMTDLLKNRKTIEFLKGANEMKSTFRKYLSDAKRDADAIVYSQAPKVDADKMDRFQKRLNEVKTEILLSAPKQGQAVLRQLLSEVDEQGIAMIVKNEFAGLIQPILANAGTDAAKIKHDLLNDFEALKARSMDEDAAEAMRLADYAEAALNARFFNSIVESNVQQNLGKLAHMYMEKPEEYFETFPEDAKRDSHLKTVEQIVAEEDAKHL